MTTVPLHQKKKQQGATITPERFVYFKVINGLSVLPNRTEQWNGHRC